MQRFFKNAQWIWCNTQPQADEYGEFVDHFVYEGGSVSLHISADSNYAAYLNGELVAFGQYADFPYDKVYDSIDITAHCQKGENRLAIIVWYYGIDFISGYYLGNAALMYAVYAEGELCCQSDESTLCRLSRTYEQHRGKLITYSIGFSYSYDATKEDEWLVKDSDGFMPAVLVPQSLPLRERSCKRLELREPVVATECKRLPDGDIVYNLGREEVGFLQLRFCSPCEQTVLVSYGEHLEDGCVRRLIGDRDFSVEYRAKQGENVFLNPFRRLGGAYLQVHCEYPLEDLQIALRPTEYPIEEKKDRPMLTEFQTRLYDMCVRTLFLCMHEHYEDCPWREQALFPLDARNQMLAGYYAFEEFEFPRSNLELISKDRREDGLLTDCYPMSMDFAIPSFSLHYVTACREYMEYSGDTDFLRTIYPKLQSIVRTFTDRIGEDGLTPCFVDTERKAPAHVGGSRYWNFYEWREGLDGLGEEGASGRPDLMLNSLLSLALQHMAVIAERLGNDGSEYLTQARLLNERIRHVFGDSDGTFFDFLSRQTKSDLGNSLAVLCGAAEDGQVVERFLLAETDKLSITLSMLCFKYDALLKIDPENAQFVLTDIERMYAPMLEYGSTTLWEDEGGAASFDGAGSLCHGWNAMPIYYFHTLLKK